MNNFIYKLIKFKKDRLHLFTYISQGLKNGSTMTELLDSISVSYNHNNSRMYKYVMDTIYNMEELGESESEALYHAELINEEEKQSIEHIFSSEPYKAMDYLNTKTSNEDNLKWAVLMLFFPTILILILYIIFQPELKEMTEQMIAPVNDLSKNDIPVPDWFQNRDLFIKYLILTLGLMFGLFGFVEFLKRKYPKVLFTLFKIKEREFVLNNFEIILSLLKSGQSLMRSVELLSNRKTDHISSKIFNEIKKSMQEGDSNISEILSKYNIDSATVSYIMSGERNNSMIESIKSVVDYNRNRYDSLIKKLSKYLPLLGEIAMTFIILIPLIDIINLTTIGVMNFQI